MSRANGRRSELRSLREALGLTLDDVSVRSGYSPAYLSRLESGERALTLSVAAKLLEVYRQPQAEAHS